MTGEPVSAALAETFSRAAARLAGAEPRKMFGFPALFINGNMFAGLMRGDRLVARLAEADRRHLTDAGAGAPSIVRGRVMKEWIVLGPALLGSDRVLGEWLEKARAYTASLPPKTAKPKRIRR
jgi:TfoX/Sxy family transcriptional regulator of competence genes